jgi:hypothetical protein
MLRSRPALVWVVLLLVYTGIAAFRYKDARQEARPYEPGHIAEALAAGHGFSYRAPRLLTGSLAGVITIAALAGLRLSVRVSSAVVVFIASISQAVPYVLSVPYSYRYRYPLDPVLLLFAAYAIVMVALRVRRANLPQLEATGPAGG